MLAELPVESSPVRDIIAESFLPVLVNKAQLHESYETELIYKSIAIRVALILENSAIRVALFYGGRGAGLI